MTGRHARYKRYSVTPSALGHAPVSPVLPATPETVTRAGWCRCNDGDLRASLSAAGSIPLCLGRGFGHVGALLGVAIITVARAMVDLRVRIDPNLTIARRGPRGWRLCRPRGRRWCLRGRRGCRCWGCRWHCITPRLHAFMTATGTRPRGSRKSRTVSARSRNRWCLSKHWHRTGQSGGYYNWTLPIGAA